MQVDVTITAVRRPEVLFETLYSFNYNLLGAHDCRAIVNVDPVGWCKNQDDIVHVVKEFFPGNNIVCFPKDPNFSEAFRRVWDRVEAEWVFHLEDDWKLERKVDLVEMVNIMDRNKNLASLRLPQFNSDDKHMKNWNLFFPWNGEYFECPEENKVGGGFCGHPSLIRGSFVKVCRELLDPTKNPEKQFHHGNPALNQEHIKWDYGVYGFPGESNYITDIGRKWMVKNGYHKKGNKAWFMQWEKEESK
jgi:hypothetical protein